MWEVRVVHLTGEGSLDRLVRTEPSERMAAFSAEAVARIEVLRLSNEFIPARSIRYTYIREILTLRPQEVDEIYQ